jgi:leucyl aminopeptidase
MPPAKPVASISLVTTTFAGAEADLLVVPWFQRHAADAVPGLDDATGGELGRALLSGEFAAKPFDLFVTPIIDRSWKARRVAVIGAGLEHEFGTDLLRKLATTAVLQARQRRVGTLAFAVRSGLPDASGDVDLSGLLQTVAEGLTLAEFDGGNYKTGEAVLGPAPQLSIVLNNISDGSPESPRRLEAAVARGRLLGECTNRSRALCNEPGNTLTPREFAARATDIASVPGLSIEVLDEHAIEQLNMGMLLGVARGSSEPPRVMVFRYEPAGAPATPVLGLVGKGITFDTGGISIKPAEGMDRMKDDMAGGAAVVCAMRAIAELKPSIRVIGIVPATENMPGGRAVKPGDVLKSAEGKTVEVLNTDAEGRLILGDGLWYARKLGATHLVDVATLTGAIVVALGKQVSGLFGTPSWWVDQVRKVGDRAGDRLWPLPLHDDYKDQLKSEIADFTNTGGRPAGSITAALFLKEFTGGLPWVHLDIAGTAWAEESKPYQPKGATGVAVRTLVELAFTAESWK